VPDAALRCDKLALSALQATVDLHLSDSGQVPVIAMLRQSTDVLRARADAMGGWEGPDGVERLLET